ncbi:hypothetical protein BH10ACT10_BH10ACT10_01550 [soil metagenome]
MALQHAVLIPDSVSTPYLRHDRVRISHPGVDEILARVDHVVRLESGRQSLVAAIITPRRLRNRVVTITLDRDGLSPSLRRVTSDLGGEAAGAF